MEDNEDVECKNVKFKIDDQMFWEMLKLEIRAKTISYSSYKKKKTLSEEKKLGEDIERLYCLIEDCDQDQQLINLKKDLQNKQDEYESIRVEKKKSAMFRAKCKYYELGEKPTRYFFSLEKHNYVSKTITRLNVNGKIITDPKDILAEQRNFYKELYSEKNCNLSEEDTEYFLNKECIRTLKDEQILLCEGSLKEKEVKQVLANMSNNKSLVVMVSPRSFINFSLMTLDIL